MAENLPRWELPEVSFVNTDPEEIKAEIVGGYEAAAGRTLATVDPIRLFLLSVAAIIIQQRVLINMAAQNNLLSYRRSVGSPAPSGSEGRYKYRVQDFAGSRRTIHHPGRYGSH